MKLMNWIGKIHLIIGLSFAAFCMIAGFIMWRIDTFLIGVIVLVLTAVLYISEKKEQHNK